MAKGAHRVAPFAFEDPDVARRAHEYAPGLVDPVDMRALFEWKGRDAAELEMWAWGLFHWLWNNKSDQLDDYQRRLLSRASPAEAWTKAFPEFDRAKPGALEKLGKLIDAHLRTGKFDAYYEVKARRTTVCTNMAARTCATDCGRTGRSVRSS